MLIWPRGEELRIEAEATTAEGRIYVHFISRAVSSSEVPKPVVQYAARTHEPVILDDASNRSSFSQDAYVRLRHSRSILCLPLIKQRRLIALLYLENSLAPGVFNAGRLALLNVLASAAAISLENGRLYRELQDREAKIGRLVDANIVGILIWDLEGRILEANDAFLRIVGYQREDLSAGRLRWTDLTPQEWHKHDDSALANLRAVGSTQPYEKEYVRKDGSRVPVLVGGALIQEGGNEGVAFVLDLSEQKRAEQALRRSHSYLAQAQRLAGIGIFAWEVPRRKALYLSEEWYSIYGYDPKHGAPTWQEFLQRVHPEDRVNLEATSDRAIAERSDYDVEFRILIPGEPPKFLHSVGEPVLGPSEELLQFVGVVMDVTESKRAEEERERLRRTEAELAHMNRVSTLGELTASLAHEIKQPIGAAVTNAEACVRLLDRDHPDITEAREAAVEMAKDIRRAADIIDRVRMLFQKGSSKPDLVDINEIIREMVVMLANDANQHSITMNTNLAAGLPRVMADRVQLQQLLMNLMLNGIEAMRNGSGELNIRSQLADDGQLLISVADTGVGLPTEDLEKMFDAFFTTKPQGTGLGLAISRSIVTSHGGRIWAAKNSGRGATFHIALPHSMTLAA